MTTSESPQSKRSAGAIILKLAAPEGRAYLVAFFLIAATNLAEIYWVRLTALAIEAVSKGAATALSALAIMGVALLILILRWLNRTWSFVPGRRIERRLRTMTFRNVIGLSQDAMDTHRTGDLVSRIINDVSDIRMVLGSGFLQITNNVIAYIFTILMMLHLVPLLAVASLLPFIPLVLIAKKLTAMTHQRSRESQEALGTLSSTVEEAVGGIEVIKSYTAESWQEARFAAVNDRHYNTEIARTWPESLFVAMMGAVVWTGIASILLAGGLARELGVKLAVGDMATFILLFIKLVWPTVALGWIINVVQRGFAAAKRLQDFVDFLDHPGKAGTVAEGGALTLRRSSPLTPSDSPHRSNDNAAIEFKHVSFRYPVRTTPTISGMDLSIRDGEWVGIVGPTASGKTTVARLISGLRTPTEGDVLIGGRAVSTFDAETRRRRVHLATQIPTLFSMSIAENLRLALPDDADDAAEETLTGLIDDVAFSADFSLMPEGFDSEIGERGLLLSGGQRQRLSLARALLSNPEVLILDDVLSAVDLTTELKILDGIMKRRHGKTTLFITHRLLLLSRLDRVLVIEDGRIAADGNLASALEQSAWLRATFEADRLAASLEADDMSQERRELREIVA